MIFELIFDVVFVTLNFFINLLPSLTIPEFLLGAIANISNILMQINFFLPVGTLFLCITTIIALDIGLLVVYGINWVVHRVPIIG